MIIVDELVEYATLTVLASYCKVSECESCKISDICNCMPISPNELKFEFHSAKNDGGYDAVINEPQGSE